MKTFFKVNSVLLLSILMLNHYAFSQNAKINWLTFEQLDDSLKVKQKNVFIDFYADWCVVCKQMDNDTYTNPKVVSLLNEDYYAVKMNIESKDTINFGNQIFVNKRLKRVNPVHEIPQLMAGRKDKPFSLPAIILLDEGFKAKARYFQFIDAEAMIKILEN